MIYLVYAITGLAGGVLTGMAGGTHRRHGGHAHFVQRHCF